MSAEFPTPDIDTATNALVPTFTAVTTAQQELRASRREFAIESSQEIVPVTHPLFDSTDGIDIEQLHDLSAIGARELHRIRKVSEVYENRLRIRLPTTAIHRAAVTAGKITSIGGIVMALHGLHEAAVTITETTQSDGQRGVTNDQIDDFYFASGVLIGELVLMATPLSANFAFQATGRLHSRLLWHRFHNPKFRSAYRLLLHHVYYVSKGIPSLILHGMQAVSERVTAFVDSVVFLVRTTWDVFNEPSVLAEITTHDFSGGWLEEIQELSLNQLRDEFGTAVDRLRDYVADIIEDLENHYNALYEEHLGGLSKRELITRIVRTVIDRF